MVSRDPVPGDAPEGEPADGRFPAPPAPREPSARWPAAPAPEASGDPSGDPSRAAFAAPPADAAPPSRPTGAFRTWRGRRPFAGGLLMTLGGAEILVTEKASIGVVVHIGMQGLTGYLIPAVLVVCGVLTIVNPAQRMFYSVLGVLLALGSWVTSNLGGFFAGLLLGILGACLTFGWVPDQEPRTGPLRRRRARRAAAADARP
ncbi:DUF6114 domain-containing protein [Streptantibioticus silvisoli]|uniref:DUF6114 domain-containing protein n=1 Tax=Streptantibioticus silvisoli TaxID=2705255 RepID=UPI003F6B4123